MALVKDVGQRDSAIKVAVGAWLTCCVGAVCLLALYSQTPGEAGAARVVLTGADTAVLGLDPVQPTLVMFLHPKCPCSKASVEELARLQRRLKGRFAARVVFAVPEGMGARWHESVLWDQAGRLSDCQRVVDRGGVVTRGAGAATSGTVGLYAADGRLLFWGGITPSRGHAGDNLGSDAIADYFGGAVFADRTDVYGCALIGPGEAGCVIRAGVDCGIVDE